MNKKERNRLKKVLKTLLAKRPDIFGVILDSCGWLTYKKMHKALMLEEGFRHLTPKSLKQFFHLYRPEGFEWNDTKARALPSEQSKKLLCYLEIVPEKDLFIALKPKLHRHVLDKGLNSQGEGWLTLTHTREMALRIGKMTAQRPIIGTLKVKRALSAGARFYKAGEFLVLTKYIKPDWLDIPPLPREKRKSEESLASATDKRPSNVEKRYRFQKDKHDEDHSRHPVPSTAGSFFVSPDDIVGLVEKSPGRRRRRSSAKGGKKTNRKKGRNRR